MSMTEEQLRELKEQIRLEVIKEFNLDSITVMRKLSIQETKDKMQKLYHICAEDNKKGNNKEKNFENVCKYIIGITNLLCETYPSTSEKAKEKANLVGSMVDLILKQNKSITK